MIVFVTLMRCDDCKAQPRQPGLNAAAAFRLLLALCGDRNSAKRETDDRLNEFEGGRPEEEG